MAKRKSKPLKTKTEKWKIKTEISTENLNGKVKIKKLKAKMCPPPPRASVPFAYETLAHNVLVSICQYVYNNCSFSIRTLIIQCERVWWSRWYLVSREIPVVESGNIHKYKLAQELPENDIYLGLTRLSRNKYKWETAFTTHSPVPITIENWIIQRRQENNVNFLKGKAVKGFKAACNSCGESTGLCRTRMDCYR